MTGRREFLKKSAILTAGAAAASLTTGCRESAIDTSALPQVSAVEAGKPLPWTNWAANHRCHPQQKLSPTNEQELVDALKNAKGIVRPVGSGHSFSPVVPTDDTLIATDLMSGVISHDSERQQAEVWGGTRIHNLGPLLAGVGQALPNQPDMDYPTIAGAVSTSVHGTGIKFGSMSDYVVGLKLATPNGDLVECSAGRNPQLFKAARTSLGALGVIASVTLQNVSAFELTETTRVEATEDLLDDLDNRFSGHRHFEFFPIPYTDLSLAVYTDPARPGDNNQGEEDPGAVNQLKKAFDALDWMPVVGPAIYERAISNILAGESDTVRTGPSYQVFAHHRIFRFREMEYTVPVEFGPDCLREILSVVRKKNLPLSFPIEYRHVKSDDIWLSMFEGKDGASISIHQYGDRGYKALFAEIEPIFWKYQGRPHWGKIHTLGSEQLAGLYPHWREFTEMRRELDPSGKMLNEHLTRVFG
ncbi:FAD-binding protein [Pseudomaricurvus alkylphenolicus]|uniref:D-arabinono-1,4-lactone oxidase n=1 Tax=Pseudomaricurvus alkylphenolicus TaxID=1306991 RepID=UPI00141EBF95|nr:D-arabinono-1,4-lactone oxidase [Pseudomaricurvus alkylphenolicus]NIB42555.1 FAD-binding protein [Pseudomaricurvus alkylphenolicus]